MDKNTKKGKVAVDMHGATNSNYAQLSASAKDFIANQNDEEESPSWFTKMTGIKEDKPITKIVNKFTEYLQKPSQILTDFFKKADTFLFDIVFGNEAGPGGSLVSRVTDSIKLQFRKVSNWLNDNILEPLKENLFGDEGIITQLKDTAVGRAASEQFKKFKNFLFGEKVLMEDGTYERKGGVFSNLINEFKATGKDLVDTAKTTVADSINAVHNFITPEKKVTGDRLVSNVDINALSKMKISEDSLKIKPVKTTVKKVHADPTVQKHRDKIAMYDAEIKKTKEAGGEGSEERIKQLISLKVKETESLEKAKQIYKERARKAEEEAKEKASRDKSLLKAKISSAKIKGKDIKGPLPTKATTTKVSDTKLKTAKLDSDNIDKTPHLAKGTSKVPRTGAYILTKGETVVNNGDVKGSQQAEATYVKQVKQNQTAGEKLKNAVDSFTSDLVGRLKERAKSFSDSIFGGDSGKERKKALEAVSTDLRGKGAKVAANVGFGILTSIFMPWGVVGGALVGLGRGLVKNSETVKQILFGDIDENGKRQGNIISKEIINTIDENKTGIKLGAIAGLASVVGLLPAVWGGTLTYMAGGLAISMAGKSEFIQRWLFGEMDENGKRQGGFAGKIKSAFGKDYKKLGLDIGLGAGVGIIGSFFLPGGPIVGALTGAAISIATNTEKFKSFFFGDKDPDTGKRHGGLLGKFTDAVITPAVNLVRTAEDKLVGWFEQKILIPIQTSMAAIGEFIYNKIDAGVNTIVNVFKGVGSYIGHKITATAEKFIKPLFDPMINGIKKVFGFAIKMVGNAIAAPFTILGQLGIMADKSNRHKNAKDYNRSTIGNALTFSKKKRAKKGLEENISFKDRIKSFGDFFNRKKRKEAVTPGYSEHGETLKQTMKEAREESKAWVEYKSYMRKHGLKDKMVSRKEFDAGKNPEGKVYSKWKTGKSGVGKAVDEAIKNANIESSKTVVNAGTVVVNEGKKRTAKEAFGKDYEKYVERFKKNHPDEPLPMTEEEFFKKKIKRNKDKAEAEKRDAEKYEKTSKKNKKKSKITPKNINGKDIKKPLPTKMTTVKVADTKIKKSKLNPMDVDTDGNIPNHADGINNASTPHLAVINSGETVIPSGDPDAKKKERKFIEKLKKRKKEREEQRMKDSSGFINQFILRYQTLQAERQGKQKEADELRKAQEAGSYETRARLAREEAEKKETKTFREKVLEAIAGVKDKYQEHIEQFKSIFGKKGKLALLLLAGIPAIKNAFKIIKETFGYGNTIDDFVSNFKNAVSDVYDKTIGNLIENIKQSFADAGGAEGALNRAKKQVKDIFDIFNPDSDDTFLQRLMNYFFPKDENGENSLDHLSRVKIKGASRIAGKVFDNTKGEQAREYLKTLKENKRAAKQGGTITGFDDTISGRAADYDLRTKAYNVNRKNAKAEIDAASVKVNNAQSKYDNIINKNVKNSKATDNATKLKEIESASKTKVSNINDSISKRQANINEYNKKINKLTNGKSVDDYIKELDALDKEIDSLIGTKKTIKSKEIIRSKELRQLRKTVSDDREQLKYLQDSIASEQKKISRAKDIAKQTEKTLDNAREAYAELNKATDEVIEARKKFNSIKKQSGNTIYDRMDELIKKQEGYKTTTDTYSSTGVRAKKTKKINKLNNEIDRLQKKRDNTTKVSKQKKLDKKIARKEKKLTKVTNNLDRKTNKFTKKIDKLETKRANANSSRKIRKIDKKIAKRQKRLDKTIKSQNGIVDIEGFFSSKLNDDYTTRIKDIETKRKQKVSKWSKRSKKVLEDPIGALTESLENVGGKISDAAEALGKATADGIKHNRVTEFGRRRVQNVKNAAKNVSNLYGKTKSGTKKVVSKVSNSKLGKAVGNTKTVKGIKSTTDAAKDMAAEIRDKVVNDIDNAKKEAITRINNRRDEALGKINDVKDKTVTKIKTKVDNTKTKINNVKDKTIGKAKTKVANAKDKTIGKLNTKLDKVENKIADVKGGIATKKLDGKVKKLEKEVDKINKLAEKSKELKVEGKYATGPIKKRRLAKKQAKYESKIAKRGKKVASYVDDISDITNTVDNVMDTAKGISKPSKAAKKASKAAKKATKVADTVANAAKVADKVDDVADAAKGASKLSKLSNAAKSAKTAVKSGPGKILELLTKAIDKVFGMFSNMLKKSGKNGVKVAAMIDKILQKGLKVATKSSAFIKQAKTAVAKAVGGAVPVLNIAMAVGGIAGGYFDAAYLFAVDESKVDNYMKAISTIWGGLRNTSYGAIFDIFNEFASEILGFNIVREISTLAYNAIADDNDAKALKNAQQDTKTDYNTMVNAEYNAFLKDDKNGDKRFTIDKETGEKREISVDEFKKMGVAKSFEEYNYEKNHKTAKMKIKTAVKDFSKYSVTDAFSKDYWKEEKTDKDGNLKTEEQLAKERGKKILNLPVTIVRGLIGDATNALDAVIRSVTTTVKDFGKNTKDALDVKSPFDVFKEPWWTPPGGEKTDNNTKEGIETSALTKIAFYINRLIMVTPAMISGLYRSIGDGFGKIVEKIRTAFGKISDAGGGFDAAFGSIESATTVLNKKWWTPPSDDNGNPFSAGSRALFYASRVLAFIPGVFVGVFHDIKKVLDPFLEPIKDVFSGVTDMISGELNLDAEEPDKVDKLGVNKFLFYGAKILGFIPKAFCAIGKVVGEKMGPIMDAIKAIMGAVGEDIVTSAEVANSAGFFSPGYWEYNAGDVNDHDLGPIRKIVFYSTRILYAPIHLVTTVIKGVAKVVIPIIKGVATFGAYFTGTCIEGAFDSAINGIGHVVSKKYWTPSNIEENDNWGWLKKIAFYISRILFFIPNALRGLGSTIGQNFSQIVDYFCGLGDAATDGMNVTHIKDWGDLKNAYDAGDKGTKYTGLAGVLFYVTRTFGILSWVLNKLFGGIAEVFDTVVDVVDGAIDKIKGFFGFGGNGEQEIDAGGNGEVNFKIKHPKFTYSLDGGNGEAPEIVNGNPYYSQNDPSRKNKSYKVSNGESPMVNETMGDRGCGPTAMAMVASKVKGHIGGNGPTDGNPYTPENMASLAEQNNYSTNAGTTPGYFTDVGSRLGMNVTPAMASRSNVEAMVDSGQPVIVQGKSDKKSSPYTKSGHYVVAVGRDKSGKIIINDPRGKDHSKAYTIDEVTDGSGMAWAFSDAGNGSPYTNKKLGKFIYSIAGGNGKGSKLNWLSVVKAVKKAIAAKKAGYSQKNHIYITVNGKRYRVRTDCSGYVGACLTVYGIKGVSEIDSRWLANSSNSTLTKAGFRHMGWSGWNKLKEGDILARDGHTEIFAYNKNGHHYVYNCGSSKSCNNPNPTISGHDSYTDVWRNTNSGGAEVTYSSSTSSSKSSGEEKVGFVSALTKMAEAVTAPYKELLEGKESTKDSKSSNSKSSDSSNSGSSTNLKGGTTEKKVWNYFTDKGFSGQATAGIMGNIYQESKFNPSLLQNGRGPAAGLFQWENINAYNAGNKREASRFGVMADRAKKKGKKWTDLKNQLDFAYGEITSKDIANRMAGRTAPSNLSKAGATPIEFNDFKNTTNVDMATRQFEAAYERASDIRMKTRTDAAKRYYRTYSGGNGDVTLAGNGDSSIGYRPNSVNRSNYPDISSSLGGFGPNNSGEPMTTYRTNSPELLSQKGMNNRMNRSEKLTGEIKQYNDEKVLEALGNISSGIQDSVTELRGTNEGINKFNSKDFSQQPVIITGNGNTTNNIVPNNNKKEVKKAKKKNTTFIDDNYDIAKQIARGIVTI